jgi:hypothetical protein
VKGEGRSEYFHELRNELDAIFSSYTSADPELLYTAIQKTIDIRSKPKKVTTEQVRSHIRNRLPLETDIGPLT